MTVKARVTAGAVTGLQALAEGLAVDERVEVPLPVAAIALVLVLEEERVELVLSEAALAVELVLCP